MFSTSIIPRETIQAYLETHYHVRGATPTTLKVGEANPTLAALHKAHGVQCSAFVTACSPYSEECSDELNAVKQAALARELNERRLSFVDGVGQHPSNGWAGEASFLVLGVSLEAAKGLGRHYGQNAIIWSGANAAPQLILLR